MVAGIPKTRIKNTVAKKSGEVVEQIVTKALRNLSHIHSIFMNISGEKFKIPP